MPKRSRVTPTQENIVDDASKVGASYTCPRHKFALAEIFVVVMVASAATIQVRYTSGDKVTVLDQLIAPAAGAKIAITRLYLCDKDTLDVFVGAGGTGAGRIDATIMKLESDAEEFTGRNEFS